MKHTTLITAMATAALVLSPVYADEAQPEQPHYEYQYQHSYQHQNLDGDGAGAAEQATIQNRHQHRYQHDVDADDRDQQGAERRMTNMNREQVQTSEGFRTQRSRMSSMQRSNGSTARGGSGRH